MEIYFPFFSVPPNYTSTADFLVRFFNL
jgi:hypothetical protein